MGMDIGGRKRGYFRNNAYWWHPLADYCLRIAPDVAERCEYWHTNDGDGLDERDSLALADLLQKEIDNGRCAAFARLRELDPVADEYPYTVENVQEFATFLRGCGGFEIW